ncbi:MAG: hypothetical protein WAM47_01715, partial [Candidatus Sulfotelmatobacter sp.]
MGMIVLRKRLTGLLLPLLLVTTVYAQRVVSGPSAAGSGKSREVAFRSTVSEVRLLFLATDEHNHTVQ